MLVYCPVSRWRPESGQGSHGRHRATAVFLLAIAASLHAMSAAEAAIGTLHIVRQVLVTRGQIVAGEAASYGFAREGQSVDTGQGVRTLKRSQAQIDFQDGSVLRVNERTDLIVEDTAALRNFHLNSGVVWVRVAKGIHTQVETPSATAVARGTVFTVAYSANGNTVLSVYEGVVDLTATGGGATVSVSEGQTITVTPNGTTPPVYTMPPTARNFRPNELPVEYGGGTVGWWRSVEADLGVLVTPGTDAVSDLRTSAVGEALQELAQGGANVKPNAFFFSDPNERATLFQNAQAVTVADIDNSGLPAAQYARTNGNASLSAAGFSPQQVAALQGLGITTVGQAIQALSANGATLNITVPTGRSAQTAAAPLTRSAYDYQQIRIGQPNYDYRLFDQNETSLSFVGIGAALALAADSRHFSATVPTLSAQAFGFANDPGLFGGRAALDGYISGKTHYTLEGNAIRVLTGGDTGTYTKADSVAVVEQTVTNNLSIFAGRKRFYDGPVFQDEVSSQLIADRYTGTGLTYKARGIRFEGAYVYDSNPDVIGAQHGALASVSGNLAGGVVGINYLRTVDLDSGTGITGHLTYPLVPGVLDFYTEVGRGPDNASLQTYGAYFPALYQKTDIDLFLEYGYHEGLGHALSITGNRDISKDFAVRAYASARGDSSGDVKSGLAGIFKFSTR